MPVIWFEESDRSELVPSIPGEVADTKLEFPCLLHTLQ